jgi:hypothetical protein
MDTKIINICLIIVFITLLYIRYKKKYKYNLVENMASVDEAINNVASLYNNSTMTVSNINITDSAKIARNLNVEGTTNLKGTTVTGITANALKVTGDANIDNILSATRGYFRGGDAGGGGGTHFPWVDGTNYIRGHTTHNGNFNVGGELIVNGRNILTELNDLKANSVRYGQSVEARPNSDSGNCFDFGSDGRTNCGNGWSVIKINKR